MGRALLLFAITTLVGCRPEIGDECETSVDCSPTGDRLCDITQPGGYCTIFNCEPDTCPDEAACIEYAAQPSTLPECRDPHATTRYQRSFCLKKCDDDSDCRDERYVCTRIAPGNPWGAINVDTSGEVKVCTVPFSGKPLVPGEHETAVCTGSSD
jgi:hypothetical protein